VIPWQFESFVPPRLERWRKRTRGGQRDHRDRRRSRRAAGSNAALRALVAARDVVAVYPANINMALNSKDYPDIPAAALWARLPSQLLFARNTWRGTR
jgi:hypothetical protein